MTKDGNLIGIDRKTGQRRVVLAHEILLSFFINGTVRSDVTNDIIWFLTTCTLIIKQVLPKYSNSYIFNRHSRFANCLTWPKWMFYPNWFSFSSYYFFFSKIYYFVTFLLYFNSVKDAAAKVDVHRPPICGHLPRQLRSIFHSPAPPSARAWQAHDKFHLLIFCLVFPLIFCRTLPSNLIVFSPIFLSSPQQHVPQNSNFLTMPPSISLALVISFIFLIGCAIVPLQSSYCTFHPSLRRSQFFILSSCEGPHFSSICGIPQVNGPSIRSSFLETEILRKINKWEKIEKNYFPYFCVLGHQKHPYVGRMLKRLYSHSILRGNTGPIWSISVAAVYSECKAT